MIPFLPLKDVNERFRAEMDAATKRVLDSGWYLLGKECEAFEAEFAAYCGVKHAIGCANGLDALKLIIRAMDIGPGDEVIAPANTYIASLIAISANGATPVLVEPELSTYLIDPAKIEDAITPHRQPAYTEWHGLNLPITERIHETIISLPISPAMTEDEVSEVISAVNAFK